MVADGQDLGVEAVSDRVRGSARRAVLGVRTVMLTGDNCRPTKAVARTIEVDTVIADVLTGEQAAWVQALQNWSNRPGGLTKVM